MLEFNSEIRTVGFYSDAPDEPVTDYGDEVPYKIYKANDNPDNATLIKLKGMHLLPEQLEAILEDVRKFNEATKAFEGE